jgi:hypothetical protein
MSPERPRQNLPQVVAELRRLQPEKERHPVQETQAPTSKHAPTAGVAVVGALLLALLLVLVL